MSIVDSLRQSLSLTERLCSVMKHSYSNKLLIKFKYSRVGTGYLRLFTFNPPVSSSLNETLNKIASKIDTFNKADKNDIEKIEIDIKEYNGRQVNKKMSTLLAFRNGHFLNINDQSYKIIENLPEIVNFRLSDSIFCNFNIYPKIELLNCYQYYMQWYISEFPRKESNFFSTSSITDKMFKLVGDGTKSVFLPKKFIGHELRAVVFPCNESYRGFELFDGGILKEPPNMPIRQLKLSSNRHQSISNPFRVVSYNILAGSCTSDSYAKNELYSYCNQEFLNPKYRKILLNEEIIGYNPDIICLQEDDLDIGLGSMDSVHPERFYRRTSEKNLTTIFRQDKFHLINEFFVDLSAVCQCSPQYAQMRRMLESSSPEISNLFFSRKNYLQCTVLGFNDGNTVSQPYALCIGNTHLYSHPFADAIRLLQATICISEMTMILNELNSKGYRPVPILCGDFNSFPSSAVYRFATGEKIQYNDNTWKTDGIGGYKNIQVDKMAGMDLSHYLSLASAFGTPKYTHLVERFSACLDYIFYDKKSLNVHSFLELPDDSVVREQVALPNQYIPSDHLALVVDLSTK